MNSTDKLAKLQIKKMTDVISKLDELDAKTLLTVIDTMDNTNSNTGIAILITSLFDKIHKLESKHEKLRQAYVAMVDKSI